jgi:hypothetical protein
MKYLANGAGALTERIGLAEASVPKPEARSQPDDNNRRYHKVVLPN